MRDRRQPIERGFLFSLIALVLFGLFVLLSASGPVGYQRFDNVAYFFTHQVLYGLLPGIGLFLFFSRMDYRKLLTIAPYAFGISVFLLILVYIPGIGLRYGGSGRWIDMGFFAFQPSEFVKLAYLIYVSAWLETKVQNGLLSSIQETLAPFAMSLSVIVFLLIMQPNTGSMMVVTSMVLSILFIAGAPWKWFVGFGFSGGALLWFLIATTEYRAQRILTFLRPELDPYGKGYHINQAFLAIGSGGLFGLGYGHSRQKYLYLPEVQGDSVFAVLAEEFGFFITIGFLVLLGFFLLRCLMIARTAADPFGRFLAVGIGVWIFVQSAMNIASMLGLMPITGVTLPFVSYGSSAFVALSIACGIMASVSRGTCLWQR